MDSLSAARRGFLLLTAILRGALPHRLLKDTMEIGVAAEPCLQRGFEKCQSSSAAEYRKEPFQALPLAILHQRYARLLFEKAA